MCQETNPCPEKSCLCGQGTAFDGTISAAAGNPWRGGSVSDMAKAGVALVEAVDPELLVRLLTRHQEELFRYIYSLLPHEEDAKDVLQETSVALYRKFADYDPQKPFLAWAYGFAHLEVLKQRERNFRGARLWSQELIERLSQQRQQHELVLDQRLQALEHCLLQLSPADQALIRQRYQDRARAKEMVEEIGKSRRTLFRELGRIRRLLFECINERTAQLSP